MVAHNKVSFLFWILLNVSSDMTQRGWKILLREDYSLVELFVTKGDSHPLRENNCHLGLDKIKDRLRGDLEKSNLIPDIVIKPFAMLMFMIFNRHCVSD